VACAFICRIEPLTKHQGVILGAAGGILFGICDVSIKAVTSGTHGLLLATPWALIGILCAIAAFYATARSLQVGDGVGVIAATATTANLLGILGGILIFGEPLGKDPVTVSGRLVAFFLAVVAVGLVPAPTRAQGAVREEEEKKLEGEEDGQPSREGEEDGRPSREGEEDGRPSREEAERASGDGRARDEGKAQRPAVGTAQAG
jgi:hypothetical protein